jgi:uncharacterized membrane protein YoaK (UPF0700 family)
MPLQPGPARSLPQNLTLGALLAGVAGAVNGIGFVLLGAYVANVTGTATALGGLLAGQRRTPGLEAGVLLGGFAAGAFGAGLLAARARRTGRAGYVLGLAIEALLLLLFLVSTRAAAAERLVALGVLCLAMGLQNALGTSVSGGAVRSTHLTGLVTDLGLELAAVLAERAGRRRYERLLLLTMILVAFLLGAGAGAAGAVAVGSVAILGPVLMLTALVAVDVAARDR